MKKKIALVIILTLIFTTILSACSFADKIPAGVYLCETPYIRLEYLSEKIEGDKIEINGTIYQAKNLTGPDDRIRFVEVGDENYDYLAVFNYRYNSEKEQLILTDRETGNRYYLNKIEWFIN